MNDESNETEIDEIYSPFWPLALLLAGLILWTAYQAYEALSQKSMLDKELITNAPTINEAASARTKLYALAEDLVQVSTRDANAAQIVRDAKIQVHQTNAPAAANPPMDPTPSAPQNLTP
jgi:hypothetical protein